MSLTTTSTVPAAAGASIVVSIFDGRRQLFPEEKILMRVRDGNGKMVAEDFYQGPRVQFRNLPVFDNFGDSYTVLASPKKYKDAGFYPVKVAAGTAQTVDLLALPNEGTINFSRARWADITASRPEFLALLSAGASNSDGASKRYSDLFEQKSGLVSACLLNLVTSASQISLSGQPALSFLKDLIWDPIGPRALAQDRFFCWADPALVSHLEEAVRQGTFGNAPPNLHPGATRSYKQIKFGEADLQITLHENDRQTVGSVNCILAELDIDYYRDPLAHIFLEVLVNAFGSLTDPRQVMALRWIAARRAGAPDFDPLFTIEPAV